MGKGRAVCFVVVIIHEGKRLYLAHLEEKGQEGTPPLPTFEGLFIPSLIGAKKFLKRYDAEFFARQFEGARVETIKTGEVLK